MAQRILEPGEIETLASRDVPRIILPDVTSLFAERATRLRSLAAHSAIGGYLQLLAALADAQQAVLDELTPQQCEALARRFALGVGRTGTTVSHFSGDLFLAASVADPGAIVPSALALPAGTSDRYGHMRYVPWPFIDPFFTAVVQATEEAILNALVVNEEMVGFKGHRAPALPTSRVMELLRRRGVV